MSSQDSYLAAKVHTASQAELCLMLNDGAVRFTRQALAAWERGDEDAEIDRLLDRALDVLEALIQGCGGGKTEISKQLEEQYVFCFRELAVGRLSRERRKVESALELLVYEQETWRLASERAAAPTTQAPTPRVPTAVARQSSLSLEA